MIRLPRLNIREKILLAICVFFLLFSFYNHKIYRPTAYKMRSLKKQAWDFKNQITNLNFQFADLDYERKRLAQEKDNYEIKHKELETKENKLFSQAQLGSFLRKITQSASAHKLDFVSITPKKSKDEEFYRTLPIEIKLSSPYSGFLNYLKELEQIANVLKIQTLDIELDRNVSGNPTVLLKLSTVLSDRPIVKDQKKIIPISSSKQLFELQRSAPSATATKLEGVKLNGIIWKGGEPTAIINNQVVKVDSFIGKRKIVKITQDSVVLDEKGVEYTLEIER